jgi:hypothetical protein
MIVILNNTGNRTLRKTVIDGVIPETVSGLCPTQKSGKNRYDYQGLLFH